MQETVRVLPTDADAQTGRVRIGKADGTQPLATSATRHIHLTYFQTSLARIARSQMEIIDELRSGTLCWRAMQCIVGLTASKIFQETSFVRACNLSGPLSRSLLSVDGCDN